MWIIVINSIIDFRFYIHGIYDIVLRCYWSWSCRASSTDIPDPLSPLLPIIHHFWLVFRASSRIHSCCVYVRAGRPAFAWQYCHLFDIWFLCIVINFLVLWFIYLSSKFFHYKNFPAYLSIETTLMFIPLMSFLLQSLVSRKKNLLLRNSFLFFPSFPLVWLWLLSIFRNTCNFPSLQKF